MNKQEWCAARFTSELPDCLPLPELREVPGCEWATYALSMAKDPDTETLASATLLLLGVYGGINEAGLSVWNGISYQPLRKEWKPDGTPAELIKNVGTMLREGAAYVWEADEARDILGVDTKRHRHVDRCFCTII